MTQQTSNGEFRTATVAVVGAGMSGLIAARALHLQGIDVIVLEAAERVGGRVLGVTSPLGSRLDLGGQWVGHGHHRFEALVAELGATLFPMETPQQPDVIRGSRRIPVLSLPMLSANLGLVRLDIGARKRKNPRSWSDRSVRNWLDTKVRSTDARRALDVMVTATTCADTETYPLDAFGALIRYQHGLAGMLKTRGGTQECLVVEGVGTLTDRLARALGPRVVTGCRVARVGYDDDGATIDTSDGIVRAKKIIVTVPPPMVASITFEPLLPAARSRLVETTHMGVVYKAIAVYGQPFWRDIRPHTEFIVLDAPGMAVFDTSPPGGPGHLCLLVAGPEARALDDLSSDERREKLLGALTDHLPGQVTRPVSWHEKSWHLDEFVGGGYATLPKAGAQANFPFPHDAVGPIHWGGTETASEHAGYIEGAIESGQRVSKEVHGALSEADHPPIEHSPTAEPG